MKILIDMNLSPRWVGVLRTAGIEAMHWSENGAATAPDETIMAFARAGGWVVLTNDLDLVFCSPPRSMTGRVSCNSVPGIPIPTRMGWPWCARFSGPRPGWSMEPC